MLLAAANAIAQMVTDEELSEDYIIPGVLNKNQNNEKRPVEGQARCPEPLRLPVRKLLVVPQLCLQVPEERAEEKDLSFNAGIAAAPIGLLLGMLGAVGLMLRNERKRKKAEARAPGANST